MHSDFGVVGSTPMKTYDAEIRVVRNNEGKSPGSNGGLWGSPLPNHFCFLTSRTDGKVIEPAFDFMCATYLTRAAKPCLKGGRNTAPTILADMADFHHYMDASGIRVADISSAHLRGYATDLCHSKSAATGKNLSASTVNRRWSTLTKFILYCMRRGYLKNVIPTGERDTKRGKFTYLDVDAGISGSGSNLLITALDPQTLDHLFEELGPPVKEIVDQTVVLCHAATTDRLMAEVCLHTGLRRAEVCNLKLTDVETMPLDQLDPVSELPVVIVGKGNKARNVPFPVWLLGAINLYVNTARVIAMAKRQALMSEPDHGYVFVHQVGNARYIGSRVSEQTFDRHFAQGRERFLMKLAKLENNAYYRMAVAEAITVHSLRHTFAIIKYISRRLSGDTQPSKYVASILGHASVETTENIYLNSAVTYESKIRERIRMLNEQRPHMQLGQPKAHPGT